MKNTRDPETGKIRQEPRPDEECDKWTRQFPHLRIIDDETFEKAQRLLQENYEKYAANRSPNGELHWKQRGSADCPPRHFLYKLIKCAECPATFHVGGKNGKYLFCPGYHKGVCSCKTTLRRDRAERMIVNEIGERILADPVWLRAVFDQTMKSWRQHEQQVPNELASTERALADTERKIARLVDRIENGYDDPDVKRRLEERRAERRDLVKQIDRLKRATECHGPEPDEAWVRERLEQLGATLNGDVPAAYALRDLVDGKIVVTEIRQDGRERFYLQGRFTLCANRVANAVASPCIEGNGNETGTDNLAEEIVIDFVNPDPLDAEAEKAKELYDLGIMNIENARRLGCSKSTATKRIKHWFESRGEQMPDGRIRRSELKCKHSDPPMYQRISDEVKQLCDDGLLLGEIAERLNCDRNTITKARVFWYESRGLEVTDGRARRKSLPRKGSKRRTDDGRDSEDSASTT